MLVAVKILHTHLSQEREATFLHEARTVAGLLHPQIIRVLDFDVQQQRPFLIMDYAPHGSLRARYPGSTKIPHDQVATYVEQIASALQYAHEQRLIHRDVKPENMLLGRNDEVLLSDFGLVTLVHSPTSTEGQAASGTIFYIAPEQIQGQPQPASDQYALAITTYAWLCGEMPFDGSMTEIIAQHLAVAPPSLCARAPEIPAKVEQVVLKALAKEPRGRFENVLAFADALEQAASGQATMLLQQAVPTSAPAQEAELATTITPQETETMQKAESDPPGGELPLLPTAKQSLASTQVAPQPDQQRKPPGGLFSRRTFLIGGGLGLGGLGLGAFGLETLLTSRSRSAPRHIQTGPYMYSYTLPKSLIAGVDKLSWSPDSRRIAAFAREGNVDNQTIHIWDALDGNHATTFALQKSVSDKDLDFAWGHSSLLMVWLPNSGEQFPTVSIMDIASKKEILSYLGHIERSESVNVLCWSSDAHKIASGVISVMSYGVVEKPVIAIWDATTGKDLATCKVRPSEVPGFEFLKDTVSQEAFASNLTPNSLLWSSDGTHILSWGDTALFSVWDSNGSLVSRYTGHWEARKDEHKQDLTRFGFMNTESGQVSWSPDGTRVLSQVWGMHQSQGSGQSYTYDRDSSTLHLWETATGKQIRTHILDKPNYGNVSIADFSWSSDSQFIAISYTDLPHFSILRASDGSEVYHDDGIAFPGWMPGKSRFAFFFGTTDLQVWDAATKRSSHVPFNGNFQWGLLDNQRNAWWSPDSQSLAIYDAGSNQVHTWKVP